MSLRRTVWPQFNFQVTFSHFFPTPPSNMASRRHFPEMARHRHFNRRRREHGDTLFCNKILVTSSRNSVIPLLLKKYRFWGENHFFSPPCVTPLGPVWQNRSYTRRDLSGKKNRKFLSGRLRVLYTHQRIASLYRLGGPNFVRDRLSG